MNFIFGIQVDNDKLYDGIETRPSIYSSLSVYFSFCLHFSSKISAKPNKIESSYLVCKLTMTS